MKTSNTVNIKTIACSNGCGEYPLFFAVCPRCKLPTIMQFIENAAKGRNGAANGNKPVSRQGAAVKTPGNGKKPLLNKTEERFRREVPAEALIDLDSDRVWCWQTFRMRFPDGGEYRPDCVVIFTGTDILPTELPPAGSVIIEIKGGYRGPGWEQGYERFKRARLQWPQYEWRCFEWKSGKWQEIMKVEK